MDCSRWEEQAIRLSPAKSGESGHGKRSVSHGGKLPDNQIRKIRCTYTIYPLTESQAAELLASANSAAASSPH
jgi:hypothetical protein